MADKNKPTFNFDFEGVAPIDEPIFTVIKDFGKFELAAFRQVTMFQAGQSITIPEIVIDGQPYTRKGIKDGGKTTAVFFTRVGQKQDGSEFTEVRIFTSLANIPVDANKIDNYPIILLNDRQLEAKSKGDTVWVCDWANLQIPAIQSNKEVSQLFGAGESFWGSADNWNTGRKPNVVNAGTEDEKKYYERYWYNFTVYPDKAAMIAAREAHFASLNGGNAPSSEFAYPATPVDWTGNEETMREFFKAESAKGDLAEVAKTCGLVADAKDKNGNPVAYKAIIADILSIPEPMVKV